METYPTVGFAESEIRWNGLTILEKNMKTILNFKRVFSRCIDGLRLAPPIMDYIGCLSGIVSLIIFYSFTISNSFAQDPPKNVKPFKSEEIWGCEMTAEYYFFAPDESRQIWLHFKKDSKHKVLLTTYERDAELVYSNDCNLIALNDDLGSNVSEIHVFQKVKGLQYKKIKHDVASKAWNTISKISDKKEISLCHTYVNAIAWSSDGQALLIKAWGHTDKSNHVDNWFGAYDLKTGNISTDLSIMNRRSICIDGKTR
jgi:hypothetical protein